MNVLVACEFSGVVREAFRRRGHNAWSCDVLPAEDHSPFHIQCDVRAVLAAGWDMMIAHTPCTRLTRAGIRWLHVPPPGRTLNEMWLELVEAVELYKAVRNAPIPRKALENPSMHNYAKALLGNIPRQVIQPHYFGSPKFKATGFELHGLPPLKRTHWMVLPERHTPAHKEWSSVHRANPGPNRWKERSRTFPPVAEALAAQWG